MHQTAVMLIGIALILGGALWLAWYILGRIERARRRRQVAEQEASGYYNHCVHCPDGTIIRVRSPISERPAPLENEQIPEFLRVQSIADDDPPTVLDKVFGRRRKRRRDE
ncbi:exported protein of unknown function [Cupriavidus taiwanensis]|uniref:Uncharacterized protein n=1 Tax=Cupriavidus taiwanensis TaxID=164546 RepID=A0A375IGZ8_9BURK|nr:hypothetical protein [Cupriavidus taiwanensis]SPK72662.1 exported protein of unknown function [Cupriavidus taiwanensis]